MKKLLLGILAGLLVSGGLLSAQILDTFRETIVWNFVNGFYSGGTAGVLIVDANGTRVRAPAIETVTSGSTITANVCGGMKRITAAGAVTTSTTNTFTAPGTANVDCAMRVCNVGTNTITLDNNALFKSIGGADIALTADDCTQVSSDGTVWRSVGSLVAN